MARLEWLREQEKEAERVWFDCLHDVDELAEKHANGPDDESLKALRSAQVKKLMIGRWRLAIQGQIAALEGPMDGDASHQPDYRAYATRH